MAFMYSCAAHTWKKQKNRSASPDDGFHERYLKLKEEIDRFAAIEDKKLEDPYEQVIRNQNISGIDSHLIASYFSVFFELILFLAQQVNMGYTVPKKFRIFKHIVI